MQATITTRRFDSKKIKQAALAVGLLTSLAIGATTASIVRDTSDNGGTAALAGATTRNEMTSYTFREQNLNLPTAGAIRATSPSSNYQFMEQNLYLPGDSVAPAAISYDTIRFRELNLDLPGSSISTAPDWRVIEANSFGENFTFADALPQAQDREANY